MPRSDQAIFTSLARSTRSGYHLVARSGGVVESEARRLSVGSPTEGALIVDSENRTSVNFGMLPSGRYGLSRTCEGPAEYSGRGGRQVYTHTILIGADALARWGWHPIRLYRALRAQGVFIYEPNPPEVLDGVELPSCHAARDSGARSDVTSGLLEAVERQGAVVWPYRGDRLRLIEDLLDDLPESEREALSFTTGLRPSSARPVRVALVGEEREEDSPRRGDRLT